MRIIAITSVIAFLLNVAAIICLLVSWLMAAGWLIDPGNYAAWIAAGLTFFAAAHLGWTR